MKKPFLFQVASHYYEAGAIENSCFIFPNRRSMVFFRKYLGDLVQEKGGGEADSFMSEEIFPYNHEYFLPSPGPRRGMSMIRPPLNFWASLVRGPLGGR